MTVSPVQQWEKLVEAFASINVATEKAPTILEVAGYPHYENVCSNILAFFLDPGKEHGLNNLALSSLLECAGQQIMMSNVSIEREVYTGNGRIDLLISADECLVAIENKIFHAVINDFADYRRYVTSLPGTRSAILLILSPYAIDCSNNAGFMCITYPEFFAMLRKNFGNYLLDADNKFLMFFLDFMQSIEHLIAGGSMNQELIAFFKRNQEQVETLLNAWNALRTELRDKIKQLDGLVEIEAPVGIAIRKWMYRESQELADDLVHDIRVDYPIAVDCWVTLNGWSITVFDRNSGNMERVKQLLAYSELDYEMTTNGKCEPFHADFNTPIELVAEQLRNVLSKMVGQLSNAQQDNVVG